MLGKQQGCCRSAKSAQSFGMDPRVALSFSTKGSAKSDDVEKVANAVQLAQEKFQQII